MSETIVDLNTIATIHNTDSVVKNFTAMGGVTLGLRGLIKSITNLGTLIIGLSKMFGQAIQSFIPIPKGKKIAPNYAKGVTGYGKSFVDEQTDLAKDIRNLTTSKNQASTTTSLGDMTKGIFSTFMGDSGLGKIGSGLGGKLSSAGGLASKGAEFAYDKTLGKVPFFGKMGKAGFKAGSKMFGIMKKTFVEMAPQMASMKLVIEPMMALISGLLAPFSILTDIFGAYGEILGTAFLPLIMDLMPIFLSLIPVIALVAQLIGSLTPLLGIITVPLTMLANIILATIPLLDFLVTGFELIMSPLKEFNRMLTDISATWRDAWIEFFSPIQDAVNWMDETQGGVADFFSNEGKYADWWKR